MHTLTRNLIATAAATLALGGAAHAQESEGPVTRAQVRAELAEARAAGTLDRFGEIPTTEAVIQARELRNQTETLALLARYELLAQQQAEAEAGAPPSPDLASYVEAGPDGPVLMIVTFDANGVLRSSETVSLSSID